MKPSRLLLEEGHCFHGFSPIENEGTHGGEVVFTTGMTGYPESLTDPSYAGQILLFTYPMIGNYGVPPRRLWESKKIHARGVIVSEVSARWSHHQGESSFLEWLKAEEVPLITGVDTRALTKVLRHAGTMRGVISTETTKELIFSSLPKECFLNEHLVKQVSTSPVTYNEGSGKKIVYAIDCGMKENIARELTSYPMTVHRVPYDYDFTDKPFDGVFISNGPGDPMDCPETIRILEKVLEKKKPVFGICLGIQLLSLAAGGKTYKLPFGHRGHNQPCIELPGNRCFVTSQNHGYAVDEKSLPKGWKVTFRNLNDGSVAGIAHEELPYFAVQFHPEATPGPTDTRWLFDKFYQLL